MQDKPAIAQLVEHLTVDCCSNQMVPGSIPGGRIFLIGNRVAGVEATLHRCPHISIAFNNGSKERVLFHSLLQFLLTLGQNCVSQCSTTFLPRHATVRQSMISTICKQGLAPCRRCGREARSRRQALKTIFYQTCNSISGLVVEYIVAIDVTRDRFPTDALLYPTCAALCLQEVPASGWLSST